MAQLITPEMCLTVLRDSSSRVIFLWRPGSSLGDLPLVIKLPKRFPYTPHPYTLNPHSGEL